MNEQANADLVLKLYDAFSRGDIQTILNHVSEDIHWETPAPKSVPYAGTFSGPKGVQQFFTALGGTQRNQKLTTDEVVAQGDKVVTIGRYSADVTETGKHLDAFVVHVFTVQNGRITRFMDYGDTAAMVEAYSKSAAGAAR
jgi:ketosteroid isomerase-like protein